MSPRTSLRSVRLQGWLLAASPCVAGHPFPKSVYWITEHTGHGAAGVMLNAPINQRFHEQCEQWILQGRSREMLEDLASAVGQTGAVATTRRKVDVAQVPRVTAYSSRVHVSLDEASAGLGRTLRLFLGQSQWRAGELEIQWRAGTWVAVPAVPELMMGDLGQLWASALQRSVGSRVLRDLIDGECDAVGRPIVWN